tara:strand:+ start:69 stop:281 length:213 start_codon:yes stop_codon:yes gene_type:complete
MGLLEALIKDKNEASKIYNKTYDKAYDRYMSSYDPYAGFEFPKARWRHEEEANKIALVKAEEASEKYYKS